MEVPITNDYTYIDMDGRSMVEAIIGCRYVVVKSGDEVYLPYGYNSLYTTDDHYSIYANATVDISLVYAYDSFVSYNDYSHLSAVDKQQVLLQSCVIYLCVIKKQ